MQENIEAKVDNSLNAGNPGYTAKGGTGYYLDAALLGGTFNMLGLGTKVQGKRAIQKNNQLQQAYTTSKNQYNKSLNNLKKGRGKADPA